jgi:ABC-type glycerol-3-phosphate transport system permease component
MSSLMLVGAVFASLALGVLVAYAICQLMFRIFRVHAAAVWATREQPQSQIPVEG